MLDFLHLDGLLFYHYSVYYSKKKLSHCPLPKRLFYKTLLLENKE